jgi:hypothetical protein
MLIVHLLAERKDFVKNSVEVAILCFLKIRAEALMGFKDSVFFFFLQIITLLDKVSVY